MQHHDLLFRLYGEFDTDTLRAHQEFLDLLPPLDSPLALDYWDTIREERTEKRAEIEAAFPEHGETLATIASRATRDQAFTALDLYSKHGRGLNALVLDVDVSGDATGETILSLLGTVDLLAALAFMVACVGLLVAYFTDSGF